MLLLRRKAGETILLGGDIRLNVAKVEGNRVVLTITARAEVALSESILIGDDIRLNVVNVEDAWAMLGIAAPADVAAERQEPCRQSPDRARRRRGVRRVGPARP
jgi:sRNA-binding carbon storage regulator CsrA